MRVGRGTVTAAVAASGTLEAFLGFDDGQVHAIVPGQERTTRVGDAGGPIAALATDSQAQVVVALRHTENGSVATSFVRAPDGGFQRMHNDLHPRVNLEVPDPDAPPRLRLPGRRGRR